MKSQSRVVSNRLNRFELMRERLRNRAHEPGADPKRFADLILAAIRDRLWEKITDAKDRPFPSFKTFVETEEPEGLGITREKLFHIAALADITEQIKEFWDKENQLKLGAPIGNTNAVKNNRDNVTLESEPPRGNSQSYLRRRLLRDKPKLYKRVIAGELSANAAAIEAGFRVKTITVPVDTPENALKPLIKIFGEAKLIKVLKKGDDDAGKRAVKK